jgi:hypothetical protein
VLGLLKVYQTLTFQCCGSSVGFSNLSQSFDICMYGMWWDNRDYLIFTWYTDALLETKSDRDGTERLQDL